MEINIRATSSNALINLVKTHQKSIFGRARLIKFINRFRQRKSDFLVINNVSIPLELSRDTDLGHYLHDGIYYEQGLLDILTFFMDKKTVFYDIGANIGFYSILFASNQKQVCMFEPNQKILKNILPILRGYTNLKVFNFGLSDKKETLYFHASSNHAMANFRPAANDPNATKLEVLPLKEVITQYGLPHPEVIKIDVEGFEMKVLQGYGEENIQLYQPIILMEYIAEFANPVGYDFETVKLFAQRCDYKIYRVENDGTMRDTEIDKAFSTSDILLLPGAKVDLLRDYRPVGGQR